MGRAHINLEDAADGTFNVKVVYAGGWDKTSHAHQYANMLLQELDRTAKRMAEPETQTVEEMRQRPHPGEGWVSAAPTLDN